MKTKFQAAIAAIKANKRTIVRKTTVLVGVGAGMLIAGVVVDKIRDSSDETLTEANPFNASDTNPFDTL